MENKENKGDALKVWKPVKQKLTIKNAISKDWLNEEAKNEKEILKEIEKKANRKYLTYKTNKYVYDFQKSQTKAFTKIIREGKITLCNADKDLLFMIYYLKLVISIKSQIQEVLVRKKKKEILLRA